MATAIRRAEELLEDYILVSSTGVRKPVRAAVWLNGERVLIVYEDEDGVWGYMDVPWGSCFNVEVR